jgi:hypothetical protein
VVSASLLSPSDLKAKCIPDANANRPVIYPEINDRFIQDVSESMTETGIDKELAARGRNFKSCSNNAAYFKGIVEFALRIKICFRNLDIDDAIESCRDYT